MTPEEKLIEQLNGLFPFLALTRKEIFDVLESHRSGWFKETAQLPDIYAVYNKQVCHAAFLLGYSYFEGFLQEILESVLQSRPSMLPGKRQVKYSDIMDCADKKELIGLLIRRELNDLLYKSMNDIVEELRSGKYGFKISDEEKGELCRASLIRNCIMHNSSIVDARLAEHDGRYQEGDDIVLSESDVHTVGLLLRSLAPKMQAAVETNHTPRAVPIPGSDSGDGCGNREVRLV
jgi:hypothetical protein